MRLLRAFKSIRTFTRIRINTPAIAIGTSPVPLKYMMNSPATMEKFTRRTLFIRFMAGK
jgi:hypothetical protein